MIGHRVPEFNLPPLDGRMVGLSSDDLIGQVSLVNVFASWCAPCRLEHPVLLELNRRHGIPIFGINYKDQPGNATRWLNTLGDPYARIGADRDGRAAIDWGVFGVPETFLVDAAGTIVHKQIGPLTLETAERTILPMIAELRR